MVSLAFMRSELFRYFGEIMAFNEDFFFQNPITNDWTKAWSIFLISTVAKLIMIKQRSEKSCWLIVLKLHEKSH